MLARPPRQAVPAEGTFSYGGGVELIVDVANVLGSRADGWWRDRAGATTRLLARLSGVLGAAVPRPGGGGQPGATVDAITVVLEGAAKRAETPPGLRVILAPGSGDDAIVEAVGERVAVGTELLVVTADRGLRSRLPDAVRVAGPDWLNQLIAR